MVRSIKLGRETWFMFLYLAVFLTIAEVLQDWIYYYGRGIDFYWPHVLMFASDWLIWLALLPIIFKAYRLLRSYHAGKTLVYFILLSCLISLLHLLIKAGLFYSIQAWLVRPPVFRNVFFKMGETYGLTCLSGLIIFYLIKFLYQKSDSPVAEIEYLKSITVRKGDQVFFVPVNEVLWLQANDNYVWIYTASGKHLVHQTISGFEKQLNPTQFQRVHRSAIVNIASIQSFSPMQKSEALITLKDGTTVKFSKTYKAALMSRLSSRDNLPK